MAPSGPLFSFRECWVAPHPLPAVHEVLLDLGRYPLWWPQVRAVARVDDDEAWVRCRSVLPYTLDLRLHAVHREPRLLETRISGDLEGVVRWRLSEEGRGTRLDFEQDVVIGNVLLARLARPAGPVLRWNHDRMMRGARLGLAGAVAVSAEGRTDELGPGERATDDGGLGGVVGS